MLHENSSRKLAVRSCALLMAILAAGIASAYEFNADNSCILLNSNNTDILSRPDDCNLPENVSWCNCTRTVLSNAVPGQTTSMEQGIIWVTGENGVGNQRIEVGAGTLDISGIEVGEVIGHSLTDEITMFGGNFTVLSEIRATAKSGNTVDFDVIVTTVSDIGLAVLTYDPRDADHSDGQLYKGKIIANAPGSGFVVDFRYEKKEGATYAGIEIGDAADPGFNARIGFAILTDGAAGSYTLPNTPTLRVTSTLRRFTEADFQNSTGEVLPLGAPDLCDVVVNPEPCREFIEDIPLTCGGPTNNAPIADVIPTDQNGGLLIDNNIFIDCGVGRVVLRGSNSTDGDGGCQGLTYLWEIVAGPEAGAAITSKSATFVDAELSVYFPGDYTVRLTVNDGQSQNNIDTQEVIISGFDGIGPNLPPEITSLTYRPDGNAEVELLPGPPEIDLQLTGESVTLIDLDADGNSGSDGCAQTLVVQWTMVSGPAPVTFSEPFDDDTDVVFTQTGDYVLRLTASDLAPEDNLASIDVIVTVLGAGVGPFVRGDCNGDRVVSGVVTDAVFMLNFNFLGGQQPPCFAACDANRDGAFRGVVTDAVYVLNFNFLGGPPPPDPYPACGTSADAGDVALGCEDASGCSG